MRTLLCSMLLCAAAFGQQITSATGGAGGGGGGGVTSIATGCGTSGGTITATGTIIATEPVNSQTGTSYTFLNGDCGKLVSHSNGSATADTLPQANGSTFISGWFIDVQNVGAGTVTITPTTSTVDGAATLVLTTGQGARIVSNGTNYFTQRGVGSSGGVTNIATTGPITGGPITATGTIACATCGVTGSPLSQFAATTSAQLRATLSDETGTGLDYFQGGDLGTPSAGVGTNLTAIPAAAILAGTFGAGNYTITGNLSVALVAASGGADFGIGSGFTGFETYNGLTSGAAGWSVADVAGTAILYLLPSTNGAANQVLMDNGAVTCPTLDPSAPTVCHATIWVASTGTGNFARATNGVFTTPNLGTPSAINLSNGLSLPNAGTTATSANTASAIVARDSSGNFVAGTITANLTGTASAVTGLSVTAGKTLSATNTLTFTGTDGNTILFPSAAGFTNNNCLKGTISGVVLSLVDAGSCASSSGGGISGYSGTGVAFASTQYFPYAGGAAPSSTEASVDIESPSAATITNLYVQLSAALGVGNSTVFTWRKNTADTSVTCTISGASATSCNDTVHSFTVAQGDLLDIKAVTTGTVVGTINTGLVSQFGTTGSNGTVNSGTIHQLALYGATGTAVSGLGSVGTTTTLLHGSASGDPSFGAVVEGDQTLADVTTLDVSTSKHGYAPKAPNDATKYLDGTGAYTVPAGGTPGALILLEEHTAANTSTEMDFVTRNVTGQSGAVFQSDYDEYRIEMVNLLPATNSITISWQASTNGGSSYDTGSNYEFAKTYYSSSISDTAYTANTSQTGIQWFGTDLNNSATFGGVSGSGVLYNPLSATAHKLMIYETYAAASNSSFYLIRNGGRYKSTTAVNAFRFLSSSGNLASGTVRVYGVAK